MLLAGVEVDPAGVTVLVSMLRDEHYHHAADQLEAALAADAVRLDLSIRDRVSVLDVLDDPPQDLLRLRAVLLNQHVWRTGLFASST